MPAMNGATITVYHHGTSDVVWTGTTDVNGDAIDPPTLSMGSYDVEIGKVGYETIKTTIVLTRATQLFASLEEDCEGDYTSWSGVYSAIISDTTGFIPFRLIVSDDGIIVNINGNRQQYMLDLSGTVIFKDTSKTIDSSVTEMIGQSASGTYQVVINIATKNIDIYKRGTLIQSISYSSAFNADAVGVAISPSGKYITIAGQDHNTFDPHDRVLLLVGS